MAGQLIIRLDPGHDATASWLTVESDGRRGPGGRGALSEARPLATQLRVVVLVPGSEVLLTEAKVPSRKPHHIRQAVPFLLEERLASDVAALHFAIGARAGDGIVPVAVVARERLQQWLDDLAGAGIVPDALLPDTLAVPLIDDGWSLAADEHGALLRSGPCAGAPLDGPGAVTLLAGTLATSEPPPARLLTIGSAAAEFAARLDDGNCPPCEARAGDDLLETFATTVAAQGVPLDLLQGEFARDAEQRARWQAWRLPAALAASLLVLLFGARTWEVQHLEAESDRLHTAQTALLKETFPEIQRAVDPPLQFRRQLAALRGDGGGERFLDLLAASGVTLAKQSGWRIVGLSYRDDALQLQLTMPAFDHFDRLRESFTEQPGLTAETGSLGSVEDEVRGSMTLRRRRS